MEEQLNALHDEQDDSPVMPKDHIVPGVHRDADGFLEIIERYEGDDESGRIPKKVDAAVEAVASCVVERTAETISKPSQATAPVGAPQRLSKFRQARQQ